MIRMQEETIVIEPTPEKQTIPQEKKKGKAPGSLEPGAGRMIV